MKHSLILWSAAVVLTFLTGYIHSGTSKYYPVTGTIGIDEKKVSYRFKKFFSEEGNYNFIIRTDNPNIEAVVKWKKSDEESWNTIEMKKDDQVLIAEIPKQNAGEKILYFAEIKKDAETFTVPDKPVTLFFQGHVPGMISFLSSFALFGGLLLSFRTGLEYFNEKQRIKKLALFTAVFFFVYTIAVTPLRKSYELNAINSIIVPITSLFELHSILLFIIWITAVAVVFKVKNPKPYALVLAFLTVVVFLYIRY
jgi:hypothetical protein